MKETVIKITPEEQLRMHQIILDKEADEAMTFLKLRLKRIERASRGEMKTTLDK